MKNRRIEHSTQEVKIYKDHYRPSLNMWRFGKAILGIIIFGSSSVAQTYVPIEKKRFK